VGKTATLQKKMEKIMLRSPGDFPLVSRRSGGWERRRGGKTPRVTKRPLGKKKGGKGAQDTWERGPNLVGRTDLEMLRPGVAFNQPNRKQTQTK